jgi:hypothetical protein
MHPDRTDPSRPCAATPPDPLACLDALGVVGLGAPVSVAIRLTPCVLPALRQQLAEAQRLALEAVSPRSEPSRAPAGEPGEPGALREMLA